MFITPYSARLSQAHPILARNEFEACLKPLKSEDRLSFATPFCSGGSVTDRKRLTVHLKILSKLTDLVLALQPELDRSNWMRYFSFGKRKRRSIFSFREVVVGLVRELAWWQGRANVVARHLEQMHK